MNNNNLFPHYVVRQNICDCECDTDDNCDCMPNLYLTNNNIQGYGVAHWTYIDETCPPESADGNKSYFCNFLGLPPFWACGEIEAAEKLTALIDNLGYAASIQYVNNKAAERLLKEVQETR